MKKAFFISIILLPAYVHLHAQCNTAFIISQGHPAFASSQENASYPPTNANDGDRTTRWSSAFSDPQYIYVDLGAITSLCQVDLIWEAAYGKDFTIDVSDDAITWTTAATITGNTSLNNTIPIAASGRYVKMNGTARGTPNGYSLYGMHVYGTAPSPFCGGTDLALGAMGVSSSDESGAYPAFHAFDGNLGTRWSSQNSDPQYLYVDLGSTYNLCNVTLSWEAAFATDFNIDVSQDAVSWATLINITGNTSTTNMIPVSGLARYVRMFGIARATAYGYSLLEFTVNGYIVLPVTLSSFNASVQNNKTVLLRWTTDMEKNNDHFSVERSTDGSHFLSIGNVQAKGNAAIQTRYTWIDSFPINGINNYRLKQVDHDGKIAYSAVAAVTVSAGGQHELSVYPNPVSDRLTIKDPDGERIISVSIWNATGIQLMEYKNVSGSIISLPVKGMPAGMYTIRATTSHHVKVSKVMKPAF